MRRWIAALAVIALPAAAAPLHGETDVFRREGVVLAWAVARGPDEGRTFVVVRAVTGPHIRSITVTGEDPFTKAAKTLVEARPTGGRTDIRIPRASFADFPRTEWHFLEEGKEPRLVVYYLGIPDTTPEFNDEAGLDAYLAKRVSAP